MKIFTPLSVNVIKNFTLVVVFFFVSFSSFSQCPVIGPEGVYNPKDDILITSYHQSIAKTPDGLITWGEDMDSNGGNALAIQEISPANGYNFTGTVLQYAVSGNSDGQGFLATTDDLYAWGGVGEVVTSDFVSGNTFATMVRPPGVLGSDILDLYATSNVLVLVTNSGNVWVASVESRVSGNTSTDTTIWQSVQTSSGVPLDDVFHVTGSDVALYALQNDGDIFVWGNALFLGDGNGSSNYNYATQMVAPPSVPSYISAFYNDEGTDHGVLALGTDRKLYGVGHNTSQSIINDNTNAVLNWETIKDASNADLINVLQISTNQTSEQYSSAAIITQGATPSDKRILLTWGSNDNGNIGQGAAGTVQDPTVPGGYTVDSDDAIYVSVGGHATTIYNKNTQTICFTGHVTDGSTGGLTGANATSFECITIVAFELCGVNTCLIDDIQVSNVSVCNDNGTPASSDDFFTADVTVSFAEPIATGTLDLSGDGSASVVVGSLDSATSHTFVGVQMTADGGAISLTAAFSDDAACSFTVSNAGTAPNLCSLYVTANNDDFSATPINPGTGGTTLSVFADNGNGVDDANGATATDANIDDNINITLDGGLTGVTINTDGTINVPAATLTGTYNVTYEICLTADNALCSTAVATIVVGACLDFPTNDCDGDGVINSADQCEGFDDTEDTDNDSIPNGCDLDDDNDGILDSVECPYSPNVNDLTVSLTTVSPTNTVISNSGVGSLEANTDVGGLGVTGICYRDGGIGANWYRIQEWTGDYSVSVGSNLNWAILVEDLDTNGGYTWYPELNALNDVVIRGNGTTLTLDITTSGIYQNTLPTLSVFTDFYNISVPLTAANFGTTTAIFNAVMSNLEYIEIRSEFWVGLNEIESCLMPWGTTNSSLNGTCDTDNDGIPDSLDIDSDNDGCLDVIEAGHTDSNGDGQVDGTGVDGNGQVTGALSAYTGTNVNVITATQLTVDTSPNNQSETDGDTAVFTVTSSAISTTDYSGTAPTTTPDYTGGSATDVSAATTYQWYLGDPASGGTALTNDTTYSGVTTASLSIVTDMLLDGNDYCVVISHPALGCSQTECATLTVITALVINAEDDDFSGTPINPETGGTTLSVFADNGNGVDDANGATATDANIDDNINITLNGGLTGVTINTDGTINIPAATPSGTYNVTYQICLTADNTICSTAVATIVVGACLDFPTNDCDGDGVINSADQCEGFDDTEDTDNDLIPNGCDLDDDNDGILDINEFLSTTGVQPICGGETSFDFTGIPTEEPATGDGNSATFLLGETFRFSNVTTGTDALVTLVSFVNCGVGILDDNSSNPSYFKPGTLITSLNSGQEAYVEYNFQFVQTGTITPIVFPEVFINFNDIDGNSDLFERNRAANPVSYTVDNPTTLTITNETDFVLATSGNVNVPGSSNVNPELNMSTRYINFSNYTIRLGVLANNSLTTLTRYHSVEFACVSNFNNPQSSISDTDGDGIANHLDTDSDNDGCFDVIEAGHTDSDNNGMVDGSGFDSNGQVTGYTTAYTGTNANVITATQVSVTTVPIDQTIVNGNPVTFSVVAAAASTNAYSGIAPNTIPDYTIPPATDVTGTIVYQWQENGIDLTDSGVYSGSSTANLTISDVTGLTGNVYNVIVTHPDNSCIDDQNSATLTTTESPSILAEKSSAISTDVGPAGASLGDTITYTITLENDGNVTLTTVNVADTLTDLNGNALTLTTGPTFVSSSLSSLEGTLQVGEMATYTATYVITQSDVDAGGISNTAVASGDSPSSTTVTDDSDDPNDPTDVDTDTDGDPDDPTVTSIAELPSINTVKTAVVTDDGDGVIGLDDTITYAITVENDGNVTLTSVGLTDTLTDLNGNVLTLSTGPTFVSSSLSSLEGTLQVGEVATYTATYVITQSDVDAGGISNTAVASGDSPSSTTVTDDSDDPNDPTDVDTDTDGDPDDPTVTSIAELPSINTVKTAVVTDDGDGVIGLDDTITYAITVENDGNVTLTSVGLTDTLTDLNGNVLTLSTGPTFVSSSLSSLEGTLQVDEVATYTATYVITQSDVNVGGVSNTVLANGVSPTSIAVSDTSDDDDDLDGNTTNDPTEILTDSTFELSIFKEVDNGSPLVGEQVIFTITLSNEGFVTANNIVVEELIPSGYSYVSSMTTGGTFSEVNGTWTVTQMNPTQVEILEITLEVLGFGDYLNIVTITEYEGGTDVNTDNNTSEAFVVPICLTIYNEFSPNGDGVNEYFNIDCIETYPNNKLEIYNRWGNMVYEKRGYRNDWDGTSNGRAVLNESDKLPVGTYYYVIDLGDGSKPKVGWLYINR